MNKYYHGFKPEIFDNFWPFFGLIAIAAMFGIGYAQSRVVKYRIRKRFGDQVIYAAAIMFALAFGIMLVAESNRGITQLFDNALGKFDSPVLSIVGLTVFIIVAMAVMALVLLLAAAFGVTQKEKQLRRQCRKLRRQLQSSEDTITM